MLALLLTSICAGVIGGVWYFRSAAPATAEGMQKHLPPDVSVALGIDLAKLRSAGVLDAIAGSSSVEEPDYRSFVSLTGFDYRTDLDYVLAGFHGKNRLFLASGRFDWGSIMKYAVLNEGICSFGFCRMASSEQERRISYFARRSNVLALSVGEDEWGANDLEEEYSWPVSERAPSSPAWLLLRKPVFDDISSAPEPLRPWLSLVTGASRGLFTLAPANGGFQLEMALSCRGGKDAEAIQQRLTAATEELRKAMTKDDKPVDGKTLPAVLASGVFTANGPRVNGVWIVDRDFLESLTGGTI